MDPFHAIAPHGMLAALRAAGVNYLLVNAGNIRYRSRFDPAGRLGAAYTAFSQVIPLLERIYQDGPDDRPSIIIYRVPPTVAAR